MSGPALAVFVLTAPGQDPGRALAALADGARAIALPAPGAWAQARNAALAAAGTAELVAFVEADVVVGPDWGPGPLLADPGLALVGGPVVAAAAAPWIDTAAHAQVLGLTGRSPRPLAGNAIARTAALRAIGGFRPVRGHHRALDGLADWQRALEELERAGWGVGVSDELAATRDLGAVGLGALLARRLQTGARTRVLAPEHAPGHPVAGALRSAAAAAVRGLRGDRDGARDRLAWAAAGAGAALGDVLAHRGLQPAAARTELLPTVAAPAPHPLRPRRPAPGRGRGEGLILLYHRVAGLEHDPLGVAVTPEQFAEQLAVLVREWRPAPLADVVSGRAGRRGVAVTFDDGYHDNLLNALPALTAAGVPATLFACTGPIAAGAPQWWDRVDHAVRTALGAERDKQHVPASDLSRSARGGVGAGALRGEGPRGPLTLTLPGGPRTWRAPADADALTGELRTALWTLPSEQIDAAVAALEAWAGTTVAAVPRRDRQLTVPELRELAAAGPFDVGAHTRTHVSLAFMTPERRARELSGGADDLEDWLGDRPSQLAYPYGVPGVDVDAATIAAARSAGYTLAVVNGGGRTGDRLRLPRRGVPAVGGDAFAAWLRGRDRR